MGWIQAEALTEEPTPEGTWTRTELDELALERCKPQNRGNTLSYRHGSVERYGQGCRCERCGDAKRGRSLRVR